MSQRTAQMSDFQTSLLLVPQSLNVFLGGGRGGGKSHGVAYLVMQHGEQYGRQARALYLRQTYKGLADFEEVCRELFGAAYGDGAWFNSHEHTWRLPNGAYFELGQYEKVGDYRKYTGRSFTLIIVDEAGQYANPAMVDKLRSNLRGPAEVPVRMVLAANPGDVGHGWLASRYALKGTPWVPFVEEKSGSLWVSCPSTLDDNPFINREAYLRELAAACVGDPELLKAWISGDWTIARGTYFAAALEEARNLVEPWEALPHPQHASGAGRWAYYLTHDYGYSAPSVTYLVAKSPGALMPDGRYAPKDSIVLVSELATVVPGELTEGLRWPVAKLSDAIKEFAQRWGVRPEGAADDAIFAEGGHEGGSIAKEFAHAGVTFHPAKKGDRKSGWQTMLRLLADAGSPDKSGLFISRACQYWWATVPFLPRDPMRPDDVDSRGPDHAADAARYGCVYEPPTVRTVRLLGL